MALGGRLTRRGLLVGTAGAAVAGGGLLLAFSLVPRHYATPLRAGDGEHVFDAFMSPGCFSERLSFFVATYSAADHIGRGGGLAAEGEDIEVLEMPLDEAVGMIGEGRIVDAKTILLLQWAKLHGFSA